MKKFLDTTGLQILWGHILNKLNGKVDKVDGKGLSTNDYTTVEKTKLAGIEENANNYSLPNAGSSLGGVKSGGVATISGGQITAISKAAKVGNALAIGSKTYDGSSAVTIAASDLGLSNALHFIGIVTSLPTSGTAGDVVLMGTKEYVYDGSSWIELGDGDSHALKTTTISAGGGLTGGGTLAANRTISHADTSSVSNVTAIENMCITGLTFDGYGHVTGVTTGEGGGGGLESLAALTFGDKTYNGLTAQEITADDLDALPASGTAVNSEKLGGVDADDYALKTELLKLSTQTVTLVSGKTSWTVSVSGVTAVNTIIVTPAPASYTEYHKAGVYCSAQTAGSLTFQSTEATSTSLTVQILILTQ